MIISDRIGKVQDFLRNNSLKDFKAHGIKAKTDGNYIILDYEINTDWTKPYPWVCRGLVLSANDLSVVCACIPKFFNMGEANASAIDWESAKAFEKIDGTMVCRWWDKLTGSFVYTTRYQLPKDTKNNLITGFGLSWNSLIEKALGSLPDSLNQGKNETLIFEITSPYNQVVVKHKYSGATLLARISNINYREISVLDSPLAPKIFNFNSIQDLKNKSSELDGFRQEGFVIVDARFNRLKVKGKDYVRLHRLKDRATSSLKSLILVVRSGEIEEVTNYFPEYKSILNKIKSIEDDLIERHEKVFDALNGIESQKDFAIKLNSTNLSAKELLFFVRNGKYKTIKKAFSSLLENRYLTLIKDMLEKESVEQLFFEGG